MTRATAFAGIGFTRCKGREVLRAAMQERRRREIERSRMPVPEKVVELPRLTNLQMATLVAMRRLGRYRLCDLQRHLSGRPCGTVRQFIGSLTMLGCVERAERDAPAPYRLTALGLAVSAQSMFGEREITHAQADQET